MEQKIRIFITGGHVTSALAVREELKRRNLPWEIFFVGRKYAMEGDREVSFEYELVTELSIPFLTLSAGRLRREISWRMIVNLVKVVLAFTQSCWYIFSYHPQLIIAFGGYVAVPVVLAGWVFGVPSVTHEQTQKAGLGNRLMGLFTKRIYVSYKESLRDFNINKTLWTGLPIRLQLFFPPDKPSFICEHKAPIIYITGGATGAESMNNLIFPIIEKLSLHYAIIHQTGATSYQEASQWKSKLAEDKKGHYLVFPYISSSDLAWIYAHSSLIIGRSGANTVGELAAMGKIAILVPLPWSANNEQQENANLLERAGSAIIVNQEKTNSKELLENILKILSEKRHYQSNAKRLREIYDTNGATRIVDDLVNLIRPISQ